jgi:hypothetical protein
MKELDGTAMAAVPAPVEECLAVLEAVDRYPAWYPEVVRDRFMPLGGVGNAVAERFVAAAASAIASQRAYQGAE